MRERAVPILCVLWLLAPLPGAAMEPGAIAQETQRTATREHGVVQVWWLPAEYWESAAAENDWAEEDVGELRSRIRNYLPLAIIDATVKGTELGFEDHLAIAGRLEVLRDGQSLEPVRKLDPSLARMIPELSLFIQLSLGPLAQGMRVLFFPNLTPEGKVLLGGDGRGELRVRYTPSGEAAPEEFRWYAPLTSVAGSTPCPSGGEPLEASWSFCPWHGVPAREAVSRP